METLLRARLNWITRWDHCEPLQATIVFIVTKYSTMERSGFRPVSARLKSPRSTAGWEYISAKDGTASMTLAFLNYPSSNSFQVRRSHGWPTSPYLLVIQADCREQTLSTKRVAARTSSNQSTRWLKSPQRVTIGLIRHSSSVSCFFSDERASVAPLRYSIGGLPLLQVLLNLVLSFS